MGKAKNGIFSLFTLILTFIFIFHYTLEKNQPLNMDSLIGLRWAILFLLSFIFIGQSIWEEREGGALGINSVYVPSYIFILTKGLVVFLMLSIVNLLVVGLFFVFFTSMKITSTKDFFSHVVFFFSSGLAISFLGIALTLLGNATRLKEILLPVLLVPLSIPVLLVGMEAERNYLLYSGGLQKPLIILFAFCTFYGALGIVIREVFET